MSPFSGGTRNASLFFSACSQVPVLVQNPDTLQEGMSTPGIALPPAATGSHISAEIHSNPLTDPVVFNLLQDPQHGTYSVALALDFVQTLTMVHPSAPR